MYLTMNQCAFWGYLQGIGEEHWQDKGSGTPESLGDNLQTLDSLSSLHDFRSTGQRVFQATPTGLSSLAGLTAHITLVREAFVHMASFRDFLRLMSCSVP